LIRRCILFLANAGSNSNEESGFADAIPNLFLPHPLWQTMPNCSGIEIDPQNEGWKRLSR
jgi:hypothetical protein